MASASKQTTLWELTIYASWPLVCFFQQSNGQETYHFFPIYKSQIRYYSDKSISNSKTACQSKSKRCCIICFVGSIAAVSLVRIIRSKCQPVFNALARCALNCRRWITRFANVCRSCRAVYGPHPNISGILSVVLTT